MNELNIKTNFNELAIRAEKLAETGRYDVDMLILAWDHLLKENDFFYDYLVDNAKDKNPDNVFYKLKFEPQEHQLVYVQLGIGYATEIRGPHWCYVYRSGAKNLHIIPTTSIKENSRPARAPYEIDIEEEDGTICRLHIDKYTCIDKMRVIDKKGYIGVKTPEDEINNAFASYHSKTKLSA